MLYEDLGDYRAAAESFVRGLNSDLVGDAEFPDFTLALYLKELTETSVISGLFVKALQQAADEDDLWWEVRALEELGWTTELHALVLEKEASITSDPDLSDMQRARLRVRLAEAKKDDSAYRKARIEQERIYAATSWD